MTKVRNPEYIKARLIKFGSFFGIIYILLFANACDFQSPSDFEMPTWFADIKFPLVQEKYTLEGLVDNKQIFSTSDSLGMQLIFEDTLPKTSINSSYLEVAIGTDFGYEETPQTGPDLTIVIDTVVNVTLPFTPGVLTNVSGIPFTVPPTGTQEIFASDWNDIVTAFDTTFPSITIELPSIDEDALPEFITEISAVVVQSDDGGDSSYFSSSIINNGMVTDVTNVQFTLITGSGSNPDTLADHTKTNVVKDETFVQKTSLGSSQLKNAIRMLYDFDVAAHPNNSDTLTVNAGDSIQVDVQIRIRISGVDSAIVQVAEYDMPIEMPAITFPSTIEIYSGVLKSGTAFGINEITISKLKSTYPFYMDFNMNFRNFIPPSTGGDSIKIDTTLFSEYSTYNKTFYIDGYTFSNPAGSDSALSELSIDFTARIRQQLARIPLDGSDLGKFTVNIALDELHFESLEANIIESFPPSEQNIAGMPSGFSGMAFTAVKFEFDMVNGIDLPVALDVDMIGINSVGDSATVQVRANIAKPSTYGSDSTRTVIRLSNIGTSVLSYATTDAAVWTDSVTTPPAEGTQTIVDLLSFNPATLIVNSSARIDGRGTITAGVSIGGSYRMVAPFEVRMDPMTFISATETPIEEMSHDIRSRIRSSLSYAELVSTVTNSLPVGGEISILLSNKNFFPLDTTQDMLSIFRDSLVVKEPGWSSSDSLYVLNECLHLSPDSSAEDLYIFGVMDDYNDCIDGVVYLVKYNPVGKDTVISYVDTLLKVILPDPLDVYSDTTTIGHPGQVKTPGVISYASVIDTNRIFLLTDYGEHYTAPRFHLNGTNGESVYLTQQDYIDINTFIIFRLSSTGLIAPAPDELIMLYPNGGETLIAGNEYFIKWKTYGSVSTVDIHYSTIANPAEDDWNLIESEVANSDSLAWVPIEISDSLRVRVRDPNSLNDKTGKYNTEDVSGWYFSVTGGLAAKSIQLSPTGPSFGKKGSNQK